MRLMSVRSCRKPAIGIDLAKRRQAQAGLRKAKSRPRPDRADVQRMYNDVADFTGSSVTHSSLPPHGIGLNERPHNSRFN